MLVRLVDRNILARAGLDYGGELTAYRMGDKIVTVYIGDSKMNLAVIEVEDTEVEDTKIRNTQWYFGEVKGPHFVQCGTLEELKRFKDNITKMITEKNEVAARDLESTILKRLNSTPTS